MKQGSTTAKVAAGDECFEYAVLSIVSSRNAATASGSKQTGTRPATVVLEEGFERWGVIAFAAAAAATPLRVFRKLIGCIGCIKQPQYHFETNNSASVTSDPNDVIARGMLGLAGTKDNNIQSSWNSFLLHENGAFAA